jgi:hypothetical protein
LRAIDAWGIFRGVRTWLRTPAADLLSKTISSAGSDGLQIDFELRADGASVSPFALVIGDHALEGAVIEEVAGSETARHPFTSSLGDGSWHHVVFRVDRQNAFVSVNVDATLVLLKTKVTTLPAASTVTLAVGVYRAHASAAWVGSFDDVSVTKY